MRTSWFIFDGLPNDLAAASRARFDAQSRPRFAPILQISHSSAGMGVLRMNQGRRALRYVVCCGLIPVFVGCAAMTGTAPRGATPAEPAKPTPHATAPARKRLPAARDLGPELDMRQWKIQCSDASLAMLCRKSDRTDRRCAARRSGKYRWTYGHFCKRSLPCSKKACR